MKYLPVISIQVVEDVFAIENGGIPQHILDAQKLVVFADAVGPAEGAGFDLAGVGSHGQVGDGGVFGFAAAVWR